MGSENCNIGLRKLSLVLLGISVTILGILVFSYSLHEQVGNEYAVSATKANLCVIRASVESFRQTYGYHPKPTESLDSRVDGVENDKGCMTLETILTTSLDKNNKLFLRGNLPNEELSEPNYQGVNTVCVVRTDLEFVSLDPPNCIAFGKPDRIIENQGYLYSLESGKIRLNYKLKSKLIKDSKQYRLSELFLHFNTWRKMKDETGAEPTPVKW